MKSPLRIDHNQEVSDQRAWQCRSAQSYWREAHAALRCPLPFHHLLFLLNFAVHFQRHAKWCAGFRFVGRKFKGPKYSLRIVQMQAGPARV